MAAVKTGTSVASEAVFEAAAGAIIRKWIDKNLCNSNKTGLICTKKANVVNGKYM